ncbi:hypothetical protein B9J78_05560 [bacterium Unc6]|nr:hypothetical protein [bacterium Unc6]
MKQIDLKKALQVAVCCAKKAGGIQMENFGKPIVVHSVSMHDIKLAVDLMCEKVIIQKLKKHFPFFSILAEESGLSETESAYRWIIDPLDGTYNYSRTIPHFSSSIALAKGDDILMGVVYDPFKDELFTAIKGKGAFKNSRRIYVSSVSKISSSALVMGFMKDKKTISTGIKAFNSIIFKVKKVRITGSASLDMCYIANGRFDGYFESGIMLWDVAAGGLILEEAGGKVNRIKQGSDFSIEMIAGNGKINKELMKILNQRFSQGCKHY